MTPASHSPVLKALFARSVNLHSPAELLGIVHDVLDAGWTPADPADAAGLLDLVLDKMQDAVVAHEVTPPNSTWAVAASTEVLRRLSTRLPISVTAGLFVLRYNVMSHRWLMDQVGADPYCDSRAQVCDYVARALMDMEPTAEERRFYARLVAYEPVATVGQVLQRRRKQRGWSQAQLGSYIGTERTTISYWETDRRVPNVEHARALAGCLGGLPEDYLHGAQPSRS